MFRILQKFKNERGPITVKVLTYAHGKIHTYSVGKADTQSSTLSCNSKLSLLWLTFLCFLLLLYSLLAFWLTLYIYSTLYFLIQTEDDRSFCRNMYLNLKSVVLFLKIQTVTVPYNVIRIWNVLWI